MAGSRFVFLDRDGTLVFDVGHGHRVEDYQLLPGVIEGLQLLRDAGFRFAIVTNQSGIGRGYFSTRAASRSRPPSSAPTCPTPGARAGSRARPRCSRRATASRSTSPRRG
jgi:hypothetical protein